MKSSEVSQTLLDISKEHFEDDSSSLKEYAERFKGIFQDSYRQRYSEILPMIDIISEQGELEDELDSEDHLDQLSANLSTIREFIRQNITQYGTDTYRGVFKLSDHVDIEIRRYRDIRDVYYGLHHANETVDSVARKAREVNKKLDKASKDAKKVKRITEKLQMQVVAILGIFAAIVVAFSGGIDLLSGAISVSGSSNIINVTFAILLCSIVLFNILAFLMYMILAILRLDKDEIDITELNRWEASRKQRISNRLDSFVGSRFIIAFNFVMVLALGIDAALMYLIA